MVKGEHAADSLEAVPLDCTDSARLLNPDGLEAAAPGASAEAPALLQGGAFTVTWLPTGRALPPGGSSAFTPTAADASGKNALLAFQCTARRGKKNREGDHGHTGEQHSFTFTPSPK